MAYSNGLIASARVGKHTDALLKELLVCNKGKTDWSVWKSDQWGRDNRILPAQVEHQIGKAGMQRIEYTNGIIQQQTGRWLSLRHATRTTAQQVQ